MNKRRILALANAIESAKLAKRRRNPIGFNMAAFRPVNILPDRTVHKCRTACCLAGWAKLIWAPHSRRRVSDTAEELLGLSRAQTTHLFVPYYNKPLFLIKPEEAVRTLRYLAKTGKVDWIKANKVQKRRTPAQRGSAPAEIDRQRADMATAREIEADMDGEP